MTTTCLPAAAPRTSPPHIAPIVRAPAHITCPLQVTGQPHPRNTPLDTSRIASIRMGTTVATNALLERKGVCT